jgi:hypothetical protein
MTRDHLKKRNLNKPETCVFCSEPESVQHLFFYCIVARNVWQSISSFLSFSVGNSVGAIAYYWIADKRHAALNSIYAAVLWSIWKLRNVLIFNAVTWLSLKQIWWIILRHIRKWGILFKESMNCPSRGVISGVTDECAKMDISGAKILVARYASQLFFIPTSTLESLEQDSPPSPTLVITNPCG